MTKRIMIDPVTRIEGHAKISIFLDDAGEVTDAQFHVTEFRGFEKFCEGRPLWEMAGITARVCGICPVSHLVASAKAGDRILAIQIPAAAEKLRRLMNLAQIVQSHALSFFHMSAPDLLLGMESDPAKRNVFGLIAAEPELARGGIRLRQFGQEIIAALGGQKIHPAWSELSSNHLRARAGINQREGVGCSEAPRGTLFHHYEVDENGLIRKVDLLIATGQNNLAMNRAVAQIAKHYLKGTEVSEGILNRVEAGIRAFDPCLSCSTHAVGAMPLRVQVVGPAGTVLSEGSRGLA